MAEFASVCPGYKQVDAFGPEDEYEEEEVTYVTLDLGNVELSLIPSSSHYRLIGLDTPTPFLQLSGTIFKGRHDALLGTELIFTDGKDPADSNKRSIVHVANTEQRIHFTEVQLKPKQTTADDEEENPKAKAKADELFKVDNITGKNGPLERRTRAPRRPRKERPQPETSGEVQDSGGTDAVVEGLSIEENPAPEVEGEKEGES